VGKSYAAGDVTATSPSGYAYAGGLIGSGDNGTVENCYVIGYVTATSSASVVYAGGLIGAGPSLINIRQCYVVGDVTATSSLGRTYAGDLIGSNRRDNYVSYSYYLSEQTVKGDTISYVGEALSLHEMKSQQSFINWDFDAIWAIDTKINEGYPYLRSLTANSGNNINENNQLNTNSPQNLKDNKQFPNDGGLFSEFRVKIAAAGIIILGIVGACILLIRKRK